MKIFENIPKVTKALLLMNILMFFLIPYIPSDDLFYMVGFGITSENFNPIQLITSMFLHAGFSHIFFNMLFLWFLGDGIEREIGDRKFLILYLLSGFGGFLLQGFFYPDVPHLGASGAVFGLIVAMGVLFPNREMSLLFLPFWKFKLKWFVLIYFSVEIYNALSMDTGDGVAHWCHVGGGITGLLLGGFWLTKNFSKFKLN